MVRVEMEDLVPGPRRVADIDTGDSARYEYSFDLSPDLIEVLVHGIIGGCGDLGEKIVPHPHHRIRRRGNNKMDRPIVDLSHPTAVTNDYSIIRTDHDAALVGVGVLTV